MIGDKGYEEGYIDYMYRRMNEESENDVCIGCGRTLEEIAHWTRITNEERKLINERVSNNIQRT